MKLKALITEFSVQSLQRLKLTMVALRNAFPGLGVQSSLNILKNKTKQLGGWTDGSAVERALAALPEPEFESQQPHGSSRRSLTLVAGLLTPSHRPTCRQNTDAHEIKINFKKSKMQSCDRRGEWEDGIAVLESWARLVWVEAPKLRKGASSNLIYI